MSTSDVDSAYQSLIVILGLTFSIMGSNPEFFWTDNPEMPSVITGMRTAVIPLLILAALMLIGMLLTDENRKIHVKLVAWATAVILASVNIMIFFQGVQFYRGFGDSTTELYISVLLIFILIPALVFRFIGPKYREMYPNASYFNDNTRRRLAITYVLYLAVILCSLALIFTPYRVY